MFLRISHILVPPKGMLVSFSIGTFLAMMSLAKSIKCCKYTPLYKKGKKSPENKPMETTLWFQLLKELVSYSVVWRKQRKEDCKKNLVFKQGFFLYPPPPLLFHFEENKKAGSWFCKPLWIKLRKWNLSDIDSSSPSKKS